MLTPVEEAGLAGQRLAARIRRAVHQLDDGELGAIMDAMRDEAARRRFVYYRDEKVEPIHLLPMPIGALPGQLSYVRAVTIALHGALRRLPDLYLGDEEVRAVLRLPDEEEAWLRRCWTPAVREHNTVFGRHDAVVDFASAGWQRSLQFVEPNLNGIGGLHLVPTAEAIFAEHLLPALARRDPELTLATGQDVRALLTQELVDHLEAVGRPGGRICFVEPKYEGYGIDEQEALACYLHDHFGVEVCHADPAELELDGDEVRYGGAVIDVAYRDYAIADLLEIAAEGVDITPMRRLFETNRVVSTIAGELDQKSCWEVLTDPVLSARHFGPEERAMFRRHLPWTRLVSDRRTSGPDGHPVELLAHARAEREHLVLKPNREYGGTGVTIGAATSASDWDAAIEVAVTGAAEGAAEGRAERWVVQQRVELPVAEFPVRDAAGGIPPESFYVVFGFVPSPYGLASLVRASQRQVVNVAQRGGMTIVAVGHPPAARAP